VQGPVAGHLLECAGQITGGYFADPGYKDVPDLARLGFPIGEDGSLVVTKLKGSGGTVTAQTCREQLLYEVHDPTKYLQPDVVADFSQVSVDEIAPNRVRALGGRGTRRPDTLKVSVGYVDSFIGEGQIFYAGHAGVVDGSVVRYELPNIAALNFVMSNTLGGGVTRSLALDAHGKSLSSALLDLEIEAPPD